MQKTVIKHGSSYAIVSDKPFLELLRVTPDTPFEIMSDGQRLVSTPVREAQEEQKLQKALEDIHAHFGLAMKKLAE
jgi:hypothetical protein